MLLTGILAVRAGRLIGGPAAEVFQAFEVRATGLSGHRSADQAGSRPANANWLARPILGAPDG
jgi:hypothetical protein